MVICLLLLQHFLVGVILLLLLSLNSPELCSSLHQALGYKLIKGNSRRQFQAATTGEPLFLKMPGPSTLDPQKQANKFGFRLNLKAYNPKAV